MSLQTIVPAGVDVWVWVWVWYCGIPLSRLPNVMSFVPQDDIVHEDLTVK